MLIACKDGRGLVHKITGVLFQRGLNITENQEFVDHSSQRFFMRTEFEGDLSDDSVRSLQTEVSGLLPSGSFCCVKPKKPPKLLVFASSELHCLGDLLVRHHSQELGAQILAVISQSLKAQDLVQRFDIPFHHLPVAGNDSRIREEHEKQVLKLVEHYPCEYFVLARYMRILTPEFVNRFQGKILNIHHSFLPAFIGKNPYEQAHSRGVKIIGATAHFVTEKLDEGPIIFQDVVGVDHTCSVSQMARLGQDVEKIVLARALNLVVDDRVLIDGNRTVVF